MRRREFITGLGSSAVTANTAWAQYAKKLPVVAILWQGPREREISHPHFQWVIESLARSGLRAGDNIRIEHFFGDANDTRFAEIAPQMMSLMPDVLVTNSGATALALKKTQGNTPLVFVATASPIGQGIVSSYARRPENITGFANNSKNMLTKRLALLKEAVPNLSKVALLVNSKLKVRFDLDTAEARTAASTMNFAVEPFDITQVGEEKKAFADMVAWGADGAAFSETPILALMYREIAEESLRAQIPLVAYSDIAVSFGALMSYATQSYDQYAGVGEYVRRILAGERATDLPIAEPVHIELCVNRSTLSKFKLNPDAAFLGRVDRFIE